MPVYTYECSKCRSREDTVFSVHTERPKYLPCKRCRAHMTRIYMPPQIATFTPYTTAHITGEDVEVRTARHEDELCRIHNKARLLSTDWIDPQKVNKERRERANACLPPIKESFDQVTNALKYGDMKLETAKEGQP